MRRCTISVHDRLASVSRLLERHPWWRMRPHPEWVQAVGGEKFSSLDGYIRPYVVGIPGDLRILFLPVRILVTVVALEPDVAATSTTTTLVLAMTTRSARRERTGEGSGGHLSRRSSRTECW